jgi:glycerophosphoryl diester phosphodiesterase
MRIGGPLVAGLACVAATSATAPPNEVTIVAHRGLAEGLPENTLAAFGRSIQRGLSVIELDVRTTRDGHLVIFHDETLDRTTDCTGQLAGSSLARIKTCDAGWPSHPGEQIPTLAEALVFARDRPVQLLLDIKPGTSVPAVLKSIRDHRAETKVILGLRRVTDVTRVRSETPAVSILAFMPKFADANDFAAAGAHIIRLWSDWVEADPSIVARTRNLGPQVWIMIGRKLPKQHNDWRALHGRMISTGAEGLITNRPDLMSAP